MCIDELRFEAAKNRVIGINRERQGIGTLSEKTVHAVLKNYYAPDTDTKSQSKILWRTFLRGPRSLRYRHAPFRLCGENWMRS